MHRLLERQLRRYLGSVDPIPEEWKRLIDAVDETYRQTDVDRTLLERSLDLTSEELFERNQQLEKIVDDLQKAMAEQEQAKTEAENARQQLEVALEEARAIHRRYQRQTWEGYLPVPKPAWAIPSRMARSETLVRRKDIPPTLCAAQQKEHRGSRIQSVPPKIYGHRL